MTNARRGAHWLILSIAALMTFPVAGSFIRCGGLPPGFGVFPLAVEPAPKPGLSTLYLCAGFLAAALILAFLLAPSLFGFVPEVKKTSRTTKPLPSWFWMGGAVNLASWALHWWGPGWIAKYTFLPLWWGFITALDGCVYASTGGRSLFATKPRQALLIALASMPAWTLFEYLNYFALGFWVYPNNTIFSPAMQAVWYILSFSTVLPAVFEWYLLFQTSDRLRGRWARGPRLHFPRGASAMFALIGLSGMTLFAAFPFQLFPLLWIAPVVALAAALAAVGYRTPLHGVEEGDWSKVVLIGLAAITNGLFWELWNFGSRYFHGQDTTNPNYWDYFIPYVNTGHFFSAMPILGYFGYLFFGTLAWLCWLVAAHLLGVDADFDVSGASDG